MANKDDFIPDDIPSLEDLNRYTKWLEDNATKYDDDAVVKDLKIDKRKSIMIRDLQLPGKYLRCPVVILYDMFPDAHPIKMWNEIGMLTIFFDGELNPKLFEKSNVVIYRIRKKQKTRNIQMMS